MNSVHQPNALAEDIIRNYKNLYYKVSNFNVSPPDALKKIRNIIKKYKDYKSYYDGTSPSKIYVSDKEIRNFFGDSLSEIEDLYQDIFVVNQLKKVNRESIAKDKAKKFDSAHRSAATAKDPLLNIMHSANRQKAAVVTDKEEIVAIIDHRLDILVQINSCLSSYGLHPLLFKRNAECKKYNITVRYNGSKGIEEQCRLLMTLQELETDYLERLNSKLPVKINGETIPFSSIIQTLYTETVLQEDEIGLYFLKKYTTVFDKNNNQQRVRFARLCTDVTRTLDKHNLHSLNDDTFWRIIHPRVIETSRKRYEEGNRSEAVEAAFRELTHHIRNLVPSPVNRIDLSKLDANAFMKAVFAMEDPVFQLAEKTSVHYKSLQQGYMEIYAGSTMAFRNVKVHPIDMDDEEAIEKLIICSHLFKVFDNRAL